MKLLNLKATTQEEQVLLDYLQETVSDTLADKINNGVVIEKDGKKLISKKTLNSFIRFATKQAQEQADKDAKSACIHSDVVFGWAIHYFEEDSIEGKLYNEDGTEYNPPKPKVEIKPYTPPVSVKKEQPDQLSLFDELEEPKTDEEEQVEGEHEETVEEPKTPVQEQPKGNALYQRYKKQQKQYPNYLLFFRVGDFYEAFEDEAITMSRILNLTLTSREMGLETRVPMCGVPYHAADIYISKLITNGYKVAICEELQNSKKTIDQETGEIMNENDTTLTYILDMFGDSVEVK